MNPKDVKPPEFQVRYAERFKRRAHRREQRNFFWGAWLVLIVAIGLGRDTLLGLRTGDWVDVGVRFHALLVPWWLAAALTAATLLLSLWCFTRYVSLRARQAPRQPGDEDHDDA